MVAILKILFLESASSETYTYSLVIVIDYRTIGSINGSIVNDFIEEIFFLIIEPDICHFL